MSNPFKQIKNNFPSLNNAPAEIELIRPLLDLLSDMEDAHPTASTYDNPYTEFLHRLDDGSLGKQRLAQLFIEASERFNRGVR